MRRVALALAAFSLAPAALAADLMPTTYAPAPLGAQPLDMSGWYLRGDVGYAIPLRPKAEGLLPGGLTRAFNDRELGRTLTLGGGIGYRFNNWFRADVTAEWRKPANVSATNSGSNYVDGYSDERAKFGANALMLNGYVDLGTWSGLTPYLGAGVGVARKEVKDWTTQVICFTGACTPSGPGGTIPDSSKTGLAWSLMGGLGVQLTDQLSLDIGYRFLNLGGMTTKADAFGVAAKLDDVKVNEVRLGMRYMFR
jgi:opacity protein-like surface antigen